MAERPTNDELRRPMTHEDIADICDFYLLRENEFEFEYLREDQEASVRNRFYYRFGPPICNCAKRNGMRCNNDSCFNRKNLMACLSSCKPNCQNNPWDNWTFAVERGKLYIQWEEGKHWGLFAFEELKKGTMIGEYTGVVHPDREFDDPIREMYVFKIGPVNQLLDGYRRGSAMRLVNNACFPNCKAFPYVHNGVYKVVYVAIRDIAAHEEITINYGWKFPRSQTIPTCYCNHEHCTHRMGDFEDDVEEEPEITFRDVTADGSGNVIELAGKSIFPREYDPSHVEDHIHPELEEVAAIIYEDGALVLTLGRVIESYLNTRGYHFYGVQRNTPNPQVYHLPKCFVFRHKEVAQIRLMSLFSECERQNMITYLNLVSSREAANLVDQELVPEYLQRLRHNFMPRVHAEDRLMEGAAAIGLTEVVLKLSVTSPQALKKSPTLQVTKAKSKRKPKAQDRDPHVVEPQNVVTINDVYVSAPTTSMKDVVTQNCNNTLFRQLVNSVVETLVIFALRRATLASETTSYEEIHGIIVDDIERYYINAQPGKSRRFLFYAHYRVGVEVNAPGSLKWLWCSLCGLPMTFESEKELEYHFIKCHQLCASSYACHHCHTTTFLPSVYRSHILSCTPHLAPLLRIDMLPFVIDAFADYVALQNEANLTHYLVYPRLQNQFSKEPKDWLGGHLLLETPVYQNPNAEEFYRTNMTAGFQMDRNTMKPINTNIPTVATRLTIQPIDQHVALIFTNRLTFRANLETNTWTSGPCPQQTLPPIPGSSGTGTLRSLLRNTMSKAGLVKKPQKGCKPSSKTNPQNKDDKNQ